MTLTIVAIWRVCDQPRFLFLTMVQAQWNKVQTSITNMVSRARIRTEGGAIV